MKHCSVNYKHYVAYSEARASCCHKALYCRIKGKQKIYQTFHSFHTGSSFHTCAYKKILLASGRENDIAQIRTANYWLNIEQLCRCQTQNRPQVSALLVLNITKAQQHRTGLFFFPEGLVLYRTTNDIEATAHTVEDSTWQGLSAKTLVKMSTLLNYLD